MRLVHLPCSVNTSAFGDFISFHFDQVFQSLSLVSHDISVSIFWNEELTVGR